MWCALQVSNPAALPDSSVRQTIAEPFVKMEVITPSEYNGTLMDLCQVRRGVSRDNSFTNLKVKARQKPARKATRRKFRSLHVGCWV